MKKAVFGTILLGAASILFAQAPTGNHEITVKSSAAEDSLLQQAKQQQETTKAYNDLLQQARTNLDVKNKPILDEMKKRSAKWQAMMDAANKDLKAKIDANTKVASDQFQKETVGIAFKAVSPQTITALSEVVKKEQGLPDNATFDPVTQKWSVPGSGTPEVKK